MFVGHYSVAFAAGVSEIADRCDLRDAIAIAMRQKNFKNCIDSIVQTAA